MIDAEAIEDIVHEVNSKASSLVGGAGLMQKSTPTDRDDLLRVMAQHAEGLARFLNHIRENGGRP